jgi:hypothetical protein
MQPTSSPVNNDCLQVDELILELADYKNEVATENKAL